MYSYNYLTKIKELNLQKLRYRRDSAPSLRLKRTTSESGLMPRLPWDLASEFSSPTIRLIKCPSKSLSGLSLSPSPQSSQQPTDFWSFESKLKLKLLVRLKSRWRSTVQCFEDKININIYVGQIMLRIYTSIETFEFSLSCGNIDLPCNVTSNMD